MFVNVKPRFFIAVNVRVEGLIFGKEVGEINEFFILYFLVLCCG